MVRTLSQIARLLRPGGWVVAQEALRSPPPRSYPRLDALGAYWDLVYQVLERAGGVPYGTVDGLTGSARAAGVNAVLAGPGIAQAASGLNTPDRRRPGTITAQASPRPRR